MAEKIGGVGAPKSENKVLPPEKIGRVGDRRQNLPTEAPEGAGAEPNKSPLEKEDTVTISDTAKKMAAWQKRREKELTSDNEK
ncbi:MAG: hypothetical protein WCT37_01020 [Patescibacteria group bacterium]|jgi:hypothetical protein